MSDVHSAAHGYAHLVKIEWNTDFDGREIDPAKEDYAVTFHGPFDTPEEANEWAITYPDDTDIHEMTVVVINRVRPDVLPQVREVLDSIPMSEADEARLHKALGDPEGERTEDE